jgi:hypothetical protein
MFLTVVKIERRKPMNLKIIFLLIIATSVAAQDNQSEFTELQNKKALLFSINELRLESFNGGIGFKLWMPKGIAMFCEMSYSYSKSEREKTERLTGNIDKDIKIGASIGVEKHLNLAKNITPYSGVSVGYSVEDKNEEVTPAGNLGNIYREERKTSSYSLSFNLSFGVEYFVTENISLAGQYNLGVIFTSGKEEYKTQYSATKVDISGFDVGTSSGALILAVYF